MKTEKKQDTRCFDLPHDVATEEIVLGMILLESTAIHEVDEILRPEVFYIPSNEKLYSVIREIHLHQEAIDMLVVVQALLKNGELEEVGGPAYISSLTTKVVSTRNIREHALYLHQLWIMRKLVIAGHKTLSKAMEMSKDPFETIDESLADIEGILQESMGDANTADLSHAVAQSVHEYREKRKRASEGLKTGVLTSISKLDGILAGFRSQQLVILAARPGMGKTAFALYLAKAAAKMGHPVVVFSLEMSATSLADRLIVAEAGVNNSQYRNASLVVEDENRVYSAADSLAELPITICDESGLSIQQIKAKAKSFQRKGKCAMVIIDYLQLLDMKSQNRSYNREQEVTNCSKEAKQLAKQLNIPVILLSQLSRKCEERADKTPMLSDLRESGSIEQDADVVLMLHRPAYYDKNQNATECVVRVAKQRDGATGDVLIGCDESLSDFYDPNEF